MNKHELDDKIKKHFSERKLEVSPTAFDRLNLETVSENISKKFIWFRVAAAILFLVGMSFFFINTKDKEIEVTDTNKDIIEIKNTEKQAVEPVVKRAEKIQKQVPNKVVKNTSTLTEVAAVKPIRNQKTHVRKVIQTSEVITNNSNQTQQIVQQINTKAKEFNIENTQTVVSIEPNKKEIAQTFNIDVDLKIEIRSSLSKKKIQIDTAALLRSVEESIAKEEQEEIRFREKAFNKISEGISYVSHTLLTDSEI